MASNTIEGFPEACIEARRFALSLNDPLIVHHYDADGVSSGAIVHSALSKEGKKPRRECIKKLDDPAIERLMKEKEVIFVDLGGGNRRVNELQDVLIIDHHQSEGIEKFQINPLLFGIDGGSELSASGTAYMVFKKHADLAITGACGDMMSPLTGMNRKILEEGTGTGEAMAENDLRFYGRYCRNLVQFLAYSDDPYVPGLSYREDKAEEMLSALSIPLEENGKKRTYSELSLEEKRQLISAISKMVNPKTAGKLIGESYIFPRREKNETYEASEFATLLNACGRHDKPDVGVRVCLGDGSALAEARELLCLHRKMLRSGIEYAGKSIQDLGRFYFLDGRGIIDEGIIGIVCGMALSQAWEKPVLGISDGEEGMIKASARSPRHLVSSGLNLGKIMKDAGNEIGGIGGGHRIAAGASIPSEKLNGFLLFFGKNTVFGRNRESD